MLGNYLGVLDIKPFKIPEAKAQTMTAGPIVSSSRDSFEDHDEIGLIAILAESSLMKDTAVKDRIKTYAKNAQNRIPHSQSLIIRVDKNEDTFDVAKLLEKLYFEGIDTDAIDGEGNNNSTKEDNNKLIGVVIIGDVPIPVVHEGSEESYPSLYPYTDFYRKQFIYNHETDKFEKNTEVSLPNPEVWHGVIVPPSKNKTDARTELIAYFDKNEAYSDGDEDFTEFDKRMLYVNHPAMEKKMNYMDYGNYTRYTEFMEEMAFNRFNKHLLKELIKGVSSDMGSDELIMPAEILDTMLDVSTEFIFKKYTSPLSMALKIYRGQLNGVFKDTGRWYGNQVDTADELITYRDEYAKRILLKKQLELEKEVNDFINDEIPADERKFEITSSAELKIKTEIISIDSGTKKYTFYSYINGKKVSNMNSVDDCGIYLGQERKSGEEILENNSVYVEANRMYDPETLINPPDDDDWELEEDKDYIKYAGCVFNNSIKIDASNLHLDPAKCVVNEAIKPLFNIVGSHEVIDKIGVGDKCDYSRMMFHPGNDAIFENDAKSGGLSDVKLKAVIKKTYNILVNNEIIEEKSNLSIREKASIVVKALADSGKTVKYEPNIPGLDAVELFISAKLDDTKEIDGYSEHREPTNETIQIIKQASTDTCGPDGEINFPQIVTPSTPADGIRYVEFVKDGKKERYDYFNFYRIDGENLDEIKNNLISKIQQNENELEDAVGVSTDIVNQFFIDNIDIYEPIIWKTLDVDQKFANITQKYTDRDSTMPTPYYDPPHKPQMKPDGYEVLHIVANGDTWGYQYGLNRAMLAQAQGSDFGEDESVATQDLASEEGETGDESGDVDDQDYLCGDPSGVEIWEWFEALQCWIEKEILPAEKLFKLDETCGALATAPEDECEEECKDEEGEEKEECIQECEDESFAPDPMDDTLTTPVEIEVEIERRSLVVEQEENIWLYPLNINGDSIMGYIDDVVHLELDNPALGTFSKNDFNFYKGEDEVKFIAKKSGTTKLKITMGSIAYPAITINIYDNINLNWASELQERGGRVSYKINVDLRDPRGNPIQGIDSDIYLATNRPTDGGFANGGKVELIDGAGQTEFVPMSGVPKIDLIEKDPYYISEPYSIYPPPSPAVGLTVDNPSYIEVGENKEISIIAINAFGAIATGFNNSVNVKLDEETEEFATVLTPTVQLTKGKGKVLVQGGKQTSDIKLIAEYSNLENGEADIPILARVDSDDWVNTYPQNLFASFVGFPAGNFFEENYFGGVHLFNGKTEAVFSFMTGATPPPEVHIMPNYQVKTTLPQQKVYIELPNGKLLFQVFDQEKLQTLVSETISLNFDEAVLWGDDTKLEEGKIYLDLLSDNYTAEQSENNIEILDYEGNKILELKKNDINLPDPKYTIFYNKESEFDLMELVLTDGLEEIARIMLNFKPTEMEPENFDEINDRYIAKKVYGGNGTNKPNGIVLYDPGAEAPEEEIGEYYGMEGDNNYLQLFAGGNTAGESTRFNLPANAVLLGDPTIQLETKPSGGLNYNYSKGRKIFQDPAGVQIASLTNFNFNNDAYEDIALVMKDGRVRLMEGGPTEPEYRDRGDIAFLSDGAVAIESFDFKNDGYEDLVIGTNEGRLAILHNDREVITRTNQEIKIGKQLYELRKGDMDADGNEDLTVLDSRGDILIFYYENGKFKENGKLLGNYGFSLKDGNLYKDLDIRYKGLQIPGQIGGSGADTSALPQSNPQAPVIGASDSQINELLNLSGGGASPPSESDSQALYDAMEKIAEAGRNDPSSMADLGGLPKLPWTEGDESETYFAPAEDISFLTIKKTVRNKERPGSKNIDLEEHLIYNIEITSNKNISDLVIAETVPDALLADTTTINCSGIGCPGTLETQVNSVRLFIGKLNLQANRTIYIDYEAVVKHTPRSTIIVQKLTEPNFLNDQYLDVIVSPPYNKTSDFIQHYSIAPRSYKKRSTSEDSKPLDANSSDIADALMASKELNDKLTAFGAQEYNKDNPPDAIPAQEGACEAVEEMMGTDCFESVDNVLGCANSALDDLADAISDFTCMGGGCFPIPWNKSFLVPGGIGPALPVFAFPTTAGPYPGVWPPFIPGATFDFPGAIQSMMRFYVAPTITGGMGIAMCWGPYMGSTPAPPPVFPIPYPPPIGNCMVVVPPSPLNAAGLCGKIEEGMNKLMETINSGINKMNSAMASVNNDQSIPAEFTQGSGDEEGAGGLEISLGVNLGESMTFEPPIKGFSNIHIPTFDTFMGKISDWVDRQTIEVTTKLLRLPTFYIYLPDFKSLWNRDFETTKKTAETWFEQMSKSAQATGKSLDSISGKLRSSDEEELQETIDAYGIDSEVIGSNTSDPKKLLKYMSAIEAQSNIYNTNVFEGLYDIANTMPIINVTEKPVEFKIPWVSASDIQAFIMKLQQAQMHYEREWNRVKDIWDQITCPDMEPEAEPGATPEEIKDSKKVRNAKCLGREIADMFLLDFDPFLESIQENIEVLQSYLTFPRKFVKFKAQLVNYIKGVACYFNVIGQMMGGWMATIREQLISWAELVLTIIEIVKNWKKLFDVFIDFDTSCSICTNERYANFGWWMLLGLIIPDIPIISFPKWPDIVFDISDIDAAINIDLPMLVITPVPLPFPDIPLITFPDFPNLGLLLQMPPLPILPRLPELPDLPELPPLPVVELPTLPPPPKLPDLGMSLEIILELVEKILKIWCLIKKALAPVPESMLNDQITLLTNRPAYLIPLDIIKLQLPNIAPFDLGFNELRIDTKVYIGLRIELLPKILDKMSEQWNEWIEAIPEGIDEFYEMTLDAMADKIEEKLILPFELAMERLDQIAELINQGCIEWDDDLNCLNSIQDEIDESVGEAFEDAEQAMQDWVDEQTDDIKDWAQEHGLDPSEWDYDAYTNAINDANETINNWSNDIADKIDTFFDEHGDLLTGLGYMIPFADKLDDVMEKYDDLEEVQQNILDNVGEGIDLSIVTGIVGMDQLFDYMNACFDDKDECDNAYDYFGYVIPDHEKTYANELISLISQLKTEIDKLNNAELVDYRKVKEDLNVPDYVLKPRTTIVDKIAWMEDELYAYSDRLEQEVEQMKNVKDLYALAEVPPNQIFPYELASSEFQPVIEEGKERVFSSAVIPKDLFNGNGQVANLETERIELEEKIKNEFKASGSEGSEDSGISGSCKGMCLPDPVTSAPTPAIPVIDNPLSSETLFMPSGNLIYSDGTSLYLKQNMNIPVNPANEGHSSHIAEFKSIPDLMESVNMMKTTLTGNGSSTFSWLPNTNPDLYGYSIEIERSILGFDADKQENNFPDTRIILLPPDEDGKAPEVYADNKLISYGTFVTNREDADTAKEYFGMEFDDTVTGVQQIRFPTLNIGGEELVINLNDNKSFVYDKFIASSYSVNMENGYYHIKMTWFDKNGKLSSYNQNELLSPQIYVSAPPPIDIAFDKEFYVPIYKDKKIKASNIFVDLDGSYEYFWYVDVENNPLTPVIGEELTIAPQHEPKEILVKLVASINMQDKGFEKYEKTFKVIVYVPKIKLEGAPVSEGVVKGVLERIKEAPKDDLNNIPFSLFRKRWDTWKNLGQIMYKNDKHTSPPLNDNGDKKYVYNDSYYTLNADGVYNIRGFDTTENGPIVFKDSDGNIIARVLPATGEIEFMQDGYELLPLPASTDLPTRISIIESESELSVGNVYYIADSNTDVTILDGPLTSYNTADIGVTAGDANPADDIIAKNIPGYGPSFPGGIAIYNQTPPQKNVALVDTDGSIRMMQAGYKLKIKNKSNTGESYIFQVITDGNVEIFDIFIKANFDNLVITDEVMDDSGIQIGLEIDPTKAFASLFAQTDTSTAPQQPLNSPSTESPFPDLDSSHPFFSQILQLYEARIISGYGDGSFQPDSKLTRAEFIKIALGVTNCFDCQNPTDPQREKYSPSIPFPDVRLPAWYYFCIWIAKDLEMVTGYGDGFFRPARNISRAEAAAVLLRQSQIDITEAPEEAFADVPDYAWYVDYVYTAVEIGLIQNNAGFVFPDEEITRGEFAYMGSGVMSMLDCHEVDEDGDGIPDWWEMENNMDPLFADATPEMLSKYQNICPCKDNPNQSDTDGDGIIDVCDKDIDNDSVSNLLCIFDDNGKIDQAKVDGSEDNCVFIKNTDQADDNNNHIGNICEICPCLDNPNQNDTDGDGIIDACDEDIDNDGIPNVICLFDDSGIVDPAKIEESEDNCIFIENTDQVDSDINKTGDLCEPFDKCPPVPEDEDGVNDEDGCPEVDDEFPDKSPGVYITPGPACSFIDYEADLVEGDIIMTAITDVITHDIIFEKSEEVTYEP